MFDDISALFPQPQKTKEILKEIFNEHKNSSQGEKEIAYVLAKTIKRDRAKQHQFMGFLIQLAFVDGKVSQSEEEILASIAEALEFDPNIYHAMFDQFEKMLHSIKPKTNIKDAYRLLGVSEDDDLNTIKKAYRKLVKEYHPDIIKSQGKNDAYMQEATAKTQEINQAYEMIKEHKK